MKMIATITLGLVLGAPTSVRSLQAQSPVVVDFCEVSKNPAAFNGKKIVLKAQYITDYVERSLIISPNCPGEGMLPYLTEHAVGRSAFDDAVWVRPPQHLKMTLTATFTGTFNFRKEPEMCMILNKEVCRRSLEIEEVDDLVLTMTPNDDHK